MSLHKASLVLCRGSHSGTLIYHVAKTNSVLPLDSSEWTAVKFAWVGDLIEYSQDSTVYIWQPHLEHIKAAGASIVISPNSISPRRVVVLLDPPILAAPPLPQLIDKIDSATPQHAKNLIGFENQVRSTLLSVYTLLISDTTVLIQRLSNAIETLVSSSIACFDIIHHVNAKFRLSLEGNILQ